MNKWIDICPIEIGRSFYSLSTRQQNTLTHQQDNIPSRTTQTLYLYNTLIIDSHLLCRHCLISWLRSKAVAHCPLCRCVIVDPVERSGGIWIATCVFLSGQFLSCRHLCWRYISCVQGWNHLKLVLTAPLSHLQASLRISGGSHSRCWGVTCIGRLCIRWWSFASSVRLNMQTTQLGLYWGWAWVRQSGFQISTRINNFIF